MRVCSFGFTSGIWTSVFPAGLADADASAKKLEHNQVIYSCSHSMINLGRIERLSMLDQACDNADSTNPWLFVRIDMSNLFISIEFFPFEAQEQSGPTISQLCARGQRHHAATHRSADAPHQHQARSLGAHATDNGAGKASGMRWCVFDPHAW